MPFGKVPEPVEGAAWLVSDWNTHFTQRTVEYGDVILGAFSAHSHTDVYKLFYDGDGKGPMGRCVWTLVLVVLAYCAMTLRYVTVRFNQMSFLVTYERIISNKNMGHRTLHKMQLLFMLFRSLTLSVAKNAVAFTRIVLRQTD